MLKYRAVRWTALLAAGWLAIGPAPIRAQDATWERWVPIPGVLDIDGPRSDGTFVVVGSAALYLVDAGGKVQPFAQGPGGYREDPGQLTFLARSPGSHVGTTNCDFGVDETYILRQHAPLGINRVSGDGEESGFFTNVTVVSRQTAMAFDQNGTFDHRLLYMGVAPNGKSSLVLAIDCTGLGYFVTRSLPVIESQMAVAPPGFGAYAGDLILVDPSGRVGALSPKGTMRMALGALFLDVVGAFPRSVGFVPEGFIERGGYAYLADRKTQGSVIAGSDTLLRVSSDQLSTAGVKSGDLLMATQDGGVFAVHCEQTCTAIRAINPDRSIHAQGHIAFSVNPQAGPSSAPVAKVSRQPVPQGVLDFIGYWGIPVAALALLVALLAAVAVQAIRRRPS